MNYRYTLDKSSKKFICPACEKKRFVRYIDNETKEYLSNEFGKCDRSDNCQYHKSPKQLFTNDYQYQTIEQKPKRERVFIPYDILKATMKNYELNSFILNICGNIPYPFDTDDVLKVVQMYNLGTVTKGKYKGALTIPYINKDFKTNTIQLKNFDHDNHTINGQTNWIHSLLKYHYKTTKKPFPNWLKEYEKNENIVNCLFGEHLLTQYPNNPIALVEAPKTAILGTLYFGLPKNDNDLIWLAVFNKSSYTYEKIKVLNNRKIVVVPDLSKNGNTFNEWNDKTINFQKLLTKSTFKVIDILEQISNDDEKNEGLDLADFLIKTNWRKFRNK